MEYRQLGQYVSLNQGLAINAGTAHLVSKTKNDEFVYPLLRIADMVSGEYEKYISCKVNPSVIAQKDDIIYTRTGQVGLVFRGYYGVVHNNSFIVSLQSDNLSKDYLYAVLNSDFVRKQALSLAKNSAQPDLTHDMFKSIVIPVPTKKKQIEIAAVYNFLSQKIEENTAVNDNLAQQAKLLYDYWFTQFDFPDENDKPYRSSGGQMVWNDLLKKKIPLGWEVKTLSELLKKNTQSFDYSSVQPTIDLSVMPSDSIALSQINSSDNFSTNLYVMKKGDILFGSIRPYLHKAGIAPCDGAVAGTVHSYHTINPNDYNFSLLTMARDSFFDYAVNTSSGTKMPVVSSDSILSFKFAYSKEVAKKFNSVPIMEIITRNVQETQRLIKLRDFLLPLLMNGQATIAE